MAKDMRIVHRLTASENLIAPDFAVAVDCPSKLPWHLKASRNWAKAR